MSNDDGRIVGRRLTAAAVDARNTNGRIELSFLDPPQSVSASAENGSIEVVVPDTEVLYRVEMDTGHGGTDNLVRTDPNSDRAIDLVHRQRLDHRPSPRLIPTRRFPKLMRESRR